MGASRSKPREVRSGMRPMTEPGCRVITREAPPPASRKKTLGRRSGSFQFAKPIGASARALHGAHAEAIPYARCRLSATHGGSARKIRGGGAIGRQLAKSDRATKPRTSANPPRGGPQAKDPHGILFQVRLENEMPSKKTRSRHRAKCRKYLEITTASNDESETKLSISLSKKGREDEKAKKKKIR